MDKEINNLEDKFQNRLLDSLKPVVKMERKHFELMREETEDIETAFRLHQAWINAVMIATLKGDE